MSIRFLCPYGHRLKVPNARQGKKGRCPVCLQRVIVPVPDPEPSGRMKQDPPSKRGKKQRDASHTNGHTPYPRSEPAGLDPLEGGSTVPIPSVVPPVAQPTVVLPPVILQSSQPPVSPPTIVLPPVVQQKVVQQTVALPQAVLPPAAETTIVLPPVAQTPIAQGTFVLPRVAPPRVAPPRVAPPLAGRARPEAVFGLPEADSLADVVLPPIASVGPAEATWTVPNPACVPPGWGSAIVSEPASVQDRPQVVAPPIAPASTAPEPIAPLFRAQDRVASRQRSSNGGSRWIVRAKDNVDAPVARHHPQQLEVAYWLAVILAMICLFGAAPAVPHLYLLRAPLWAQLVLLLAGAQLVYTVWLVSLPDWTTVWVGMLVFAGTATLYGVCMAWIASTPAGQGVLELSHWRNSAAPWCGANVLLAGLASYACGRISTGWYRKERSAHLQPTKSVSYSRS